MILEQSVMGTYNVFATEMYHVILEQGVMGMYNVCGSAALSVPTSANQWGFHGISFNISFPMFWVTFLHTAVLHDMLDKKKA